MRAGKSAADAETTPALSAMAAPKKNPEIRMPSSPGAFISISNFCSILAPHSHTDRGRIPRPRNLGDGCSFPTGAVFQPRRAPAMQSSFRGSQTAKSRPDFHQRNFRDSTGGEGRQIDLEVISVEAHRHVEIQTGSNRRTGCRERAPRQTSRSPFAARRPSIGGCGSHDDLLQHGGTAKRVGWVEPTGRANARPMINSAIPVDCIF